MLGFTIIAGGVGTAPGAAAPGRPSPPTGTSAFAETSAGEPVRPQRREPPDPRPRSPAAPPGATLPELVLHAPELALGRRPVAVDRQEPGREVSIGDPELARLSPGGEPDVLRWGP